MYREIDLYADALRTYITSTYHVSNPALVLSSLGLDPTELLVHGLSKTLYVCPLIDRPRRYLLGLERRPEYILPEGSNVSDGSNCIAGWWRRRWLANRVTRPGLIGELQQHTLVRPVRHGARVKLPEVDDRCRLRRPL